MTRSKKTRFSKNKPDQSPYFFPYIRVKRQVNASTTVCQKQLKLAKTEYAKSCKELSKWENLMLDSIEGSCVFTPEQVKKRMDAVQQSVDDLGNRSRACSSKLLRQQN